MGLKENSKKTIARSAVAFFLILPIHLSAQGGLAKSSRAIASDSLSQTQVVPDIRSLERLRAGLAPGTVAWATLEQLHPTQPQVGLREVERKKEEYEDQLRKNGHKFSKELFTALFNDLVVPVYVGRTPKSDSRSATQPVLGYVTDRTHSSYALAKMIRDIYGAQALIDPVFDKKGRPLNVVLVKVMSDESDLSEREFEEYMIKNKHTYLENWKKTRQGKTVIEKIPFDGLPERVNETTENPYRDLIGDLQENDKLEKVPTDYSQFVDAKALLKNKIVSWEETDLNASGKRYKKAFKRAADFFASRQADGLPGTPGGVCKELFRP